MIHHIVVAFGGQYEDRWNQNLCAWSTMELATEYIKDMERWLTEIRKAKWPEECAEHNIDNDDEESFDRIANERHLFQQALLDRLGVTSEVDRQFLLDNWETSYDCDRPNFKVSYLGFRE